LALGGAAAYAAYKGGLREAFPSVFEDRSYGGSDGPTEDNVDTSVWARHADGSEVSPENPIQPGEDITYYADATAQPDPIATYANFNDFEVPPFNVADAGWAGDFDWDDLFG
jgi:hypothetical protein